jgi:hypothetical protein
VWNATVDPTSTNDSTEGYEPGSFWADIDTGTQKVWLCIDATEAAATWVQIG